MVPEARHICRIELREVRSRYYHSRAFLTKPVPGTFQLLLGLFVQFFGTDPGAGPGGGGNCGFCLLYKGGSTDAGAIRFIAHDRLRFLFPDIGVQHGMDYPEETFIFDKAQAAVNLGSDFCGAHKHDFSL